MSWNVSFVSTMLRGCFFRISSSVQQIRRFRMAGSGASNKYLNMTVNFKEENGKEYAEVTTPGFSFTDFDRTGNVAPWNLQKIFAGIRVVALEMINPNTNEPFLQISKFWKDNLVFYVSCSIDWEREFYRKGNLYGAVRQVVLPGYVGTTSYNTLNKMYSESTGTLLASSVSQVVLVSRTTRRPIPLPEYWRERYQGMMPEVGSLKIDLLPTPVNTIDYPLKVAWSDADGYRHTSMSCYIRFCLDAGAMASLSGKYKNFPGDLANIPLRSMVSAYKGESTPGEVLTVKTWEPEDRDDTIQFQIFKADKLLFQLTTVYYRDMPLIGEGVADGAEHQSKNRKNNQEKSTLSKY